MYWKEILLDRKTNMLDGIVLKIEIMVGEKNKLIK